MKKITLILGLVLIAFSVNAMGNKNVSKGYDGNSFIFVEGDVEFSIFPDGQFDFVYIGQPKSSRTTIHSPNINISYNSGYNYDAYVQYDNYGAVIQVESVPIYYDYYGRIIQAGNVDIQYNDRRLVRVGGMHVLYNNYGHYSHYTGVINRYNTVYVYRPWHVYYARPLYTHVIVYDYPYRRYYKPVRYSYQDHVKYYNKRDKVAYHNGRRDFYRPGSRTYDERGRSSVNKEYDPNRKNTMISQSTRNNGNNAGNRVNNSEKRTNPNENVRVNNTSNNVRTSGSIDRNVISNSSNTENLKTNTPVKNSNSNNSNVRTNTNSTTRNNVNVQNSQSTPVKAPVRQNNVQTPVKVAPQPSRSSVGNNNSVRNTQGTRNNVQTKSTSAPKRETVNRNTTSSKAPVTPTNSNNSRGSRSNVRG